MGRRCYPFCCDRFNYYFLGCQARPPEGHAAADKAIHKIVQNHVQKYLCRVDKRAAFIKIANAYADAQRDMLAIMYSLNSGRLALRAAKGEVIGLLTVAPPVGLVQGPVSAFARGQNIASAEEAVKSAELGLISAQKNRQRALNELGEAKNMLDMCNE